MNDLKLLQIKSNDEIRDLIQLAQIVFPQTYQSILKPAQIDYMMSKMYAVDVIQNQIKKGVEFYLLKNRQKLIGYLSIELNCPKNNQLYIHKIYLLPENQGKGFGKWMLNQIEKLAYKNQIISICLNVNRYNKAKEFYLNQGFEVLKEEDIDIGNNYYMNDYVMIKKIK